jgi:spore maturation protein CgeB
MASRILIAGETGNHCLEMSYYKAFQDAGHEVKLYDTKKAVMKYARLGALGYRLHQFLPVDVWIRKANKEFTEEVKLFKPDILIAFTGAEILPGSFAYIKSILPVRIAWYWADPLPNLSRYLHQGLPLADLVASYSSSSLQPFTAMGARAVCWLPFAGDTEAHYMKAAACEKYTYDISFIGSWRPEREAALKTIFENFPGLRFKISGPYWNRCSFKPIRKLAGIQSYFGQSFSAVVQQSFLNLNVIDNSNFPSVNMRFFEIITAGGLALSSTGPEMETTFIDKAHLLYFNSQEQLVETVRYAFDNAAKMETLKTAAQQLLMEKHLYRHRASSLHALLTGTNS